MTLDTRQRRGLAFLAMTLLLGVIMNRLFSDRTATEVVAPSTDTVAVAERRLAQLRDTAATVPSREENLKKITADLAAREKGLIVADTAAQAQAQLIQIVRALGNAENPPVPIRATEGFLISAFGDAYGLASVSITVDCRIDQLINMMAGLGARPELVSTTDMRIMATPAKEKTISVHLTVSGVVPRKLVPAKRT
jgi:hypothetical protein